MPCKPEIRRRYVTRHEAWEYLGSRGFSCGALSAWENGRWAATVIHDEHGFNVRVWLRAEAELRQAA